MKRTQTLQLIDGKFFRGNEEVKLEFGNKEQIALIHEAQRRVEALKGDGLIVEPEFEIVYKSTITFKCICGQSVWKEDDDAPNENHISSLVGKCKCMKCHKIYQVKEEDGELIVTLLS